MGKKQKFKYSENNIAKGNWLTRRIHRTVDATGAYSDNPGEVGRQFKRFKKGTPAPLEIGDQELFGYSLGALDKKNMKQWKTSEYKPSRSKDPNTEYLTGTTVDTVGVTGALNDYITMVGQDSTINGVGNPYFKGMRDPFSDHTISFGTDKKGKYMSIWDIWDFKHPIANMFLKRKPETYDRFHYKENPSYNPDSGVLDSLQNIAGQLDMDLFNEKEGVSFDEWKKADQTSKDFSKKANITPKNRDRYILKKQEGGLFTRAQNDSIFNANTNVPFVNRMLNKPLPFKGFPKGHEAHGKTGSHYMGSYGNWVMPSIQQVGDSLELIPDNKVVDIAKKNKNFIYFKDQNKAIDFAKNYKNSNFWDNFIKQK